MDSTKQTKKGNMIRKEKREALGKVIADNLPKCLNSAQVDYLIQNPGCIPVALGDLVYIVVPEDDNVKKKKEKDQ